MSEEPAAQGLPYGIGRVGPRLVVMLALLGAIAAWGVNAYLVQEEEGEIVTGMRDIGTMGGAAWGLYIVFVVYFVGVSFAGITVAAMVRLLDIKPLKPVTRIAELLTIVSLLLAAGCIMADLGDPVRGVVNLFRYARPQSPFFGTFSLVISGYLFASLVYFYLDARRDAAVCARHASRLRWLYRLWAAGYRDTPAERRRHERASFFLALAIAPLLVTAHSTLGFVFGLQVGRPGWFSTLQAPGFVVMAGISGTGLLIVIAAIVRVALGERARLSMTTFRALAMFLLPLTAAYLYFLVVDWLVATYEGQEREVRLAQDLLYGNFASVYWLSVAALFAAFALLVGQVLLRRFSIGLLVVCGLLVNVAAIGKRFLIVVPSQVQGMLLPYAEGHYEPTAVEYSVVVGLAAVGAIMYTTFVKVFPIMETDEGRAPAEPALARAPSDLPARRPDLLRWRRPLVAGLMVVTGFALQGTSYFLLAAPWGNPPSSPVFSNPRPLPAPIQTMLGLAHQGWLDELAVVPPAPTFFVAGVMLVFLAGIAYELLPEPRSA